MIHKTALFIDLDGTVLLNPFETAVFPLITSQLSNQTELPAESIKKLFYLENERRINEATDPSLAFDWDDIVRTVAANLGLTFNTSIEALVNEYARPPYISVIGNSDVKLREIREPHMILAAATNGLSKYQLPVLRALKMDQLFDAFLSPDITKALKGDKEFYRSVAEKVTLSISIGDSYEYDVVRPKSLGMYTIWIDSLMDTQVERLSPFERVNSHPFVVQKMIRPDAIILNFSELHPIITRIEQHHYEANHER